ncbi:prenyltransferase/squalene oxidase repeat-containing protein [Zavarzinella formosa]|uniref:prenyltransferase/squalene oxidase repeat-containing protein n=1 Tax=Zavarzinella formosa TaxID=360055 RepID=UPI0002EB72AA|nr:prenyltransferase/squalene oxidase repeat-containing protein [Zavarzinella formosa]
MIRTVFTLLILASILHADTPIPKPTQPDEPMAPAFSATKAAAYIDGVSLAWTRERKCMTCHTNVPYMLARPLLKTGDESAVKEIRGFLEATVKKWETGKPRTDYEVLATAFALAGNDRQTSGKLQPATKAALDKSWTLQKADGSWNWPDCDWPPLEHDQFYGVAFMAVAVGLAPDKYAETPAAKAGLEKMRAYLKKNPPTETHHRMTLLWAATLGIDGFLTDEEKKQTVVELLNKQQADGGWNLPSLGPYTKRKDGTENKMDAPSDGYATGFTLYVLRQAGMKTGDPSIEKGLKWVLENQRESGRWFTRSVKADKAHYITNAGSAYCVLALDACGVKMTGRNDQ